MMGLESSLKSSTMWKLTGIHRPAPHSPDDRMSFTSRALSQPTMGISLPSDTSHTRRLPGSTWYGNSFDQASASSVICAARGSATSGLK